MISDPAKILVIAKEASLRSRLRRALEALGFDVGEAANGVIALTRLRMVDYEAIILECRMFGGDSMAVCKQLRSLYSSLPILILSARNSVNNKVAALEAGADDYMVRPFSERELSARLRSAIRRSHPPAVGISGRFVIGKIVLDSARHRVEKSGSEVSLTPLEFRTLQMLMQQAGRPITYSALLVALWGQDSKPHREHLRVVISALRKKIEDNPSCPTYVTTHSFFGYCFRDQ